MSLPASLRPAVPDWLRQALHRARLRLRGKIVRCGPGARIDSYTKFDGRATLDAATTIFGSRVGRWTYFGKNTLVIYSDVGAFCSIAANVVIGGGRHPTDRVTTSPLFYSAAHDNQWGVVAEPMPRREELPRTHVGNDVWIGYSAVVLPGMRVGDGAVVGAGAVVTQDVEPYSIVAGVPARSLRMRFEPGDVEWLLALRWWDWPDARLKALRARFSSVASLREALVSEAAGVAACPAP